MTTNHYVKDRSAECMNSISGFVLTLSIIRAIFESIDTSGKFLEPSRANVVQRVFCGLPYKISCRLDIGVRTLDCVLGSLRNLAQCCAHFSLPVSGWFSIRGQSISLKYNKGGINTPDCAQTKL